MPYWSRQNKHRFVVHQFSKEDTLRSIATLTDHKTHEDNRLFCYDKIGQLCPRGAYIGHRTANTGITANTWINILNVTVIYLQSTGRAKKYHPKEFC